MLLVFMGALKYTTENLRLLLACSTVMLGLIVSIFWVHEIKYFIFSKRGHLYGSYRIIVF